MNKVNIALLDSGIDKFSTGYRKSITYITNETWDVYGHGTMCFNILKNNCLYSNIDIIKILDSKGFTNIQILYNALSDLIDSDINIINLSLSVIDNNNSYYYSELYDICNKLLNNNKIIVCSLKNREYKFSIPAVYDSVIGVRGGCFQNDTIYWYNPNINIQVIANATPTLTRTLYNKRTFFSGNSKATIIMTSKIANTIYLYKDTQKLQKILLHDAQKISWYEKDVEITYSNWPNIDNNILTMVDVKILDHISNLIQKYKCFDINTINKFLIPTNYLNLNLINNYIYLINIIEKEKNIIFKDESIQLTDFNNIYSLCFAIKHNWEKYI